MKYKVRVKTNELFLLHNQHVKGGQELILTSDEFDKVESAVDVLRIIKDKPKVLIKVKPPVEEPENTVEVLENIKKEVKEKETGKKVAYLWMKESKIKFKSVDNNKVVSKIIRKYQMKRSGDLELLIEELKEKGFDVSG